MEREILFRGKRVDNGEWIEGYFVKYQPCANKDEWIVGIVPEYASALYLVEVVIETVSRYTDLTDKNGRRIFEGDILEALNGNRGYVVFESGAFMKLGNNEDIPFLIAADVNEVIGNIHDNPELMAQ